MEIIFKDYSTLNKEESLEILKIRNTDFIRKNMINNELINFENHAKWINTLRDNSEKKYFAVICDELVCGSCSLVKENENFTWGIFFKTGINPVISSLCAYLFIENSFLSPDIKKIGSLVKKDNRSAYRFNKNLGFELYKEDEKYFYLELRELKWENSKNSKLLKPIKNYLDKIEYEFK